jgi:hypothetical protein
MTVTKEENERMAAYLQKKYRSVASLKLEEGKDVVVRVENIETTNHKRGDRTESGYRLKFDEVDGKPAKLCHAYLSKGFNSLVLPHAVNAQGKKFLLGYTKGANHQRVWKFEPMGEVG